MEEVHFFVFGQVQGVSYRYYCAKKARELNLSGFVRNLEDGRVEVLAEGEAEKISAFLKFCKKNLGQSTVEQVKIKEKRKLVSRRFDNFEIM